MVDSRDQRTGLFSGHVQSEDNNVRVQYLNRLY